jgi:hypothetical protein
MDLYEKINALYDTLTDEDFSPDTGTIYLRETPFPPPEGKVKVGRAYIESWTHPTLAEPTQAQLDAIGD